MKILLNLSNKTDRSKKQRRKATVHSIQIKESEKKTEKQLNITERPFCNYFNLMRAFGGVALKHDFIFTCVHRNEIPSQHRGGIKTYIHICI